MTKLFKAPTSNFWSTTLNGAINSAVDEITLNSVTGLQAPGYLIIDRQDGNDNDTPENREVVYFTGINGNSLTGVDRGADGSTARSHSDGSLVEAVPTVGMWNDQRDWAVVEHEVDGTHKSAAVTTLKASGAEINTGTNDAKIVTPKAIADSGIAKAKATGAEVTTGTDDVKFATAKALADAGVNTRLASKVITATRDLTAASGDVSYSGVGFKPTSLICFFAIGATGNGGWGFSDSSLGKMHIKIQGGDFSPGTAHLINVETVSGNWQLAVVKSYDNDGFTLTWTKHSSPTGTLTMIFLCFR